jgi:hypothetical protein
VQFFFALLFSPVTKHTMQQPKCRLRSDLLRKADEIRLAST